MKVLLLVTALVFCACNKKNIVATPPNLKQSPSALEKVCSPGFEKLVFADQDQQTLYKFRCLWALERVGDEKTLRLWILDPDQGVRLETKTILDKLEMGVK